MKKKLENIGLEITCKEELDLYGLIYNEAQIDLLKDLRNLKEKGFNTDEVIRQRLIDGTTYTKEDK